MWLYISTNVCNKTLHSIVNSILLKPHWMEKTPFIHEIGLRGNFVKYNSSVYRPTQPWPRAVAATTGCRYWVEVVRNRGVLSWTSARPWYRKTNECILWCILWVQKECLHPDRLVDWPWVRPSVILVVLFTGIIEKWTWRDSRATHYLPGMSTVVCICQRGWRTKKTWTDFWKH